MRILAAALLMTACVPGAMTNAWATDLFIPYPSAVEGTDEVIVAYPVRRVFMRRYGCTHCTRLPLGGLREPFVAHVPLGGLRESCPPVVVETIRRPVLRVRG